MEKTNLTEKKTSQIKIGNSHHCKNQEVSNTSYQNDLKNNLNIYDPSNKAQNIKKRKSILEKNNMKTKSKTQKVTHKILYKIIKEN